MKMPGEEKNIFKDGKGKGELRRVELSSPNTVHISIPKIKYDIYILKQMYKNVIFLGWRNCYNG